MAKSHITKVKTETSFVPKKIKKQKLLFKCKINELNWIQDSPKKKKNLWIQIGLNAIMSLNY